MDIGQKIKVARIAKGMTQEQLGEVLGIQKSAVAKYENGRVVNIKRSTLKKLSEVLDIPPVELVVESDLIQDKEKSPPQSDGLTKDQKLLIDFAKSVPADKAALILRTMKAILESD